MTQNVNSINAIQVTGLNTRLVTGQLLRIEVLLTINNLCLFDPVLRLFIRQPGEEKHLLSADTHDGNLFFPWLPRGTYQFIFNWPVTLPAGRYELSVSWGAVQEIRIPDFSQAN